jgi:hypothetical protein
MTRSAKFAVMSLALAGLTFACAPDYRRYDNEPAIFYEVHQQSPDDRRFLAAMDGFAELEGYRRYSSAPYSYVYTSNDVLIVITKGMTGPDAYPDVAFRVGFHGVAADPSGDEVLAAAARAVEHVHDATRGDTTFAQIAAE